MSVGLRNNCEPPLLRPYQKRTTNPATQMMNSILGKAADNGRAIGCIPFATDMRCECNHSFDRASPVTNERMAVRVVRTTDRPPKQPPFRRPALVRQHNHNIVSPPYVTKMCVCVLEPMCTPDVRVCTLFTVNRTTLSILTVASPGQSQSQRARAVIITGRCVGRGGAAPLGCMYAWCRHCIGDR